MTADGTGQISDGYHTFSELYEHRHALCLALMKAMPDRWWFSKRHHDGGLCFGSEDWFIIGATLPGVSHGEITYHLPSRLWEHVKATGAAELERRLSNDERGKVNSRYIRKLRDSVYPLTVATTNDEHPGSLGRGFQ